MFKASIGFSIPVTRMFNGSIGWRGVIYSILMLVAKLVCGAWLIRFVISLPRAVMVQRAANGLKRLSVPYPWAKQKFAATPPPHTDQQANTAAATRERIDLQDTEDEISTAPALDIASTSANDRVTVAPSEPEASVVTGSRKTTSAAKPFSLYPSAILGLAMVSRGEIGFLISSLAESNGIFSSGGNDEVFLIVTWAIVLCTVIGPVGVGLLVRRVRALEKKREERGSGRDVLGAWGVSQ